MHPDTRNLLGCSRFVLLVSLLCCALFARAGSGAGDDFRPYDRNADARAQIEALFSDRASGKRILLTFGANWCPDSRSLERRYRTPELAALLEREFRVLHVDVGMRHRNLDIVEKYGNPIDKGIPSVVLLAPDGKVLYTDHGSLSSAGHMSDPDVIAFFERLAAAYPAP
jgi:thioredoxin 1